MKKVHFNLAFIYLFLFAISGFPMIREIDNWLTLGYVEKTILLMSTPAAFCIAILAYMIIRFLKVLATVRESKMSWLIPLALGFLTWVIEYVMLTQQVTSNAANHLVYAVIAIQAPLFGMFAWHTFMSSKSIQK
ncbi:MAG: hypothetical protein ACYC0V_01425 [Armatimonadota bacterium]